MIRLIRREATHRLSALRRRPEALGARLRSLIVAIGLSLFGIGCSCSTVPPGHVGVGVDMSGVQPNLYHEGFHVTSITTDIIPVSLQTQIYEMGGAGSEMSGRSAPDDRIHALTQDQLSVDLEVTINFHLNEEAVIAVYRAYSLNYAERVVHPIVRTAVRDAASTFTAVNLVDNRNAFQERMETMVRDTVLQTLTQRELPQDSIVIENILLRNIDLPQSLDASIEAVQQQRQQTAQRQQALETARAEADRLRVEAEGFAQAQLARARAEAEANRTVSESLTPEVLEARRIDAMRALLESDQTRTIMIPPNLSTTIMLNPSGGATR